MAIFKCKMCGGTIEFALGDTVGVCDYCGTKQTLPRLDDDRRSNLYDRANHFRRNNEFDKAAGIYEQILNENTTDAEAYWSIVLCHYGIEYVEDPTTKRRVPTVNRAQFTSIFDDDNYKSAIKYADEYQRDIYESEANSINEIQKSILAISQKEEPFDIFICYKETDANGRRTQDSVLANDLYHQLTNEGFKVFFSRITLEDKLGTAYEPYIFAALNSAKAMVVLGTKREYFNAVWVKNEWSRYLTLVKESGGKKVLIPAYRDMDPYDLPEEFSHLQAQDMSKLGFMQDLIRGIKKILKADEQMVSVKESVVVENTTNVNPLLKRAFMALEDGEWERADDFCEQVLNQEPENAQAYLGKLMVELKVHRQEDLKNCEKTFDKSNNYQKVLRFGDEIIVRDISEVINYIKDRNEKMRLNNIYDKAVSSMKSANSESKYLEVAEMFKTILYFKDAKVLSKQCFDRAEDCRKDYIYLSAKSKMLNDSIDSYELAINEFNTISNWKDSEKQIYICKEKIEEIKVKKEEERLERKRQAEEMRNLAIKRKKIIMIISTIGFSCIFFVVILIKVIIPKIEYSSAMKLFNSHQYEEAYKAFIILNNKKSQRKAEECLALIQKESFKNVSVGSTIQFGYYEQDNNTSNGKEEIEWNVLDINENKALLISKYALDCQQYNSEKNDKYTNWKWCSLRIWLNKSFFNEAFNSYHQQMIISTTEDEVFLLSIDEANKYFDSDAERRCKGTAYCYAQGTSKQSSDGDNCKWWLKSDTNDNVARYVRRDGSVGFTGSYVVNIAVRPAIWINIE